MGAGGGSALGAGAELFGAYSSSEGLKAKGEWDRAQGEINAQLSGIAAQDAIKRGEKDAQTLRKQSKQMIGSQRAALAAQGIDVSLGSAADIQADTAELAAQDALTIRNNAWREAWGYRTQGANALSQGRISQAQSRSQAFNTMLAGGLSAAGSGAKSYSQYRDNSIKG